MHSIKIVEKKKEHYDLFVDGELAIKNKERSFYRQLLETVDKDIND
jgi:hypothetical protein